MKKRPIYAKPGKIFTLYELMSKRVFGYDDPDLVMLEDFEEEALYLGFRDFLSQKTLSISSLGQCIKNLEVDMLSNIRMLLLSTSRGFINKRDYILYSSDLKKLEEVVRLNPRYIACEAVNHTDVPIPIQVLNILNSINYSHPPNSSVSGIDAGTVVRFWKYNVSASKIKSMPYYSKPFLLITSNEDRKLNLAVVR